MNVSYQIQQNCEIKLNIINYNQFTKFLLYKNKTKF